jgi:hypothetical protein
MMSNTRIKQLASTVRTLSVLSAKSMEIVIPTLIAAEKDPTAYLQGLAGSLGALNLAAPFAVQDADQWIDPYKLIGFVPWALLMTGLLGSTLPAAWFVASFGSDYVLKLISAYQNRADLTSGDLVEVGLEGVKRALLAGLMFAEGPSSPVIKAIKENKSISAKQFYLATTVAGASLSSFVLSSGRMAYQFFKPPVQPTPVQPSAPKVEDTPSCQMV